MSGRRIAAVLFVLAALAAGCGKAVETGRPAPSSTTATGTVTSGAPAGSRSATTTTVATTTTEVDDEHLGDLLIGLDELPGDGWATSSDSSGSGSSDQCGFETSLDDTYPKAEASFSKGAFGPFVFVGIVRFPSKAVRAEMIGLADQSMADCIASSPVPDSEDPEQLTTYSEMKAPKLPGVERTHAFRMSAEGSFPVQGDVLYFEGRGTTLVLVAHAGVGGLDFDDTQKIAEAQALKAA
jgi:hypothetical protein